MLASFPPVLAGTGSSGTAFTGNDTGTNDVVFTAGSGDSAWRFDVDTATFKPDEYIVTADAIVQEATGTALFNVVERSSANAGSARPAQGSLSRPAGSGYYITIDPIGNRYVGEKFAITGRTNLPEDAEMLVQVYSSSFKPTQKAQSGEFSGASGTVRASGEPAAVAALAPPRKDAGIVGTDAKIIRTGSVTLEVVDVAAAVESFQGLVAAQGGYLSSSTIQAAGSRHTGTVVLRIPQARFETTLSGVKSAGTVQYVSTQGEDVTEEYVDLQAQKKSYQVQLAQYYVLMKKAVNIADILAIQQQIDRVQTELDRLEGRLKYLDSRIELSTITISLQEPEPVHTEPGHNFVSAINRGIEGLFGLIDAIIITVITSLPFIVLAGLGLCIYQWRKGKRPVPVVPGPEELK